MPRATKGAAAADRKMCRYTCDHWIDGGRLYVKVTALQWERATDDSFNLTARRKMRSLLESLGFDRSLAMGIGALREWDRSHNWADQLTDSITFVLVEPLPVDTDAAVAVA